MRQRALVTRVLRNNGLNSQIPFDIDALVNELDQLVSKGYDILHSSLVFQAPAASKSKMKSHSNQVPQNPRPEQCCLSHPGFVF